MAIISVTLSGVPIPVDRQVFSALFENSVAGDRAPVRNALTTSHISFSKLIEMARLAEIPYPLFFAPLEVVTEHIRIKNEKLLAGFTKSSFSMNSREPVRLSDVELIVKDLLRKQTLLREDKSLTKNKVVGCIRKTGPSLAADAAKFKDQVGFTTDEIKAQKSKGTALELLIARLEAKQVLVAQSARNYMPQLIPPRARFSGMAIKDPRVPYVFLASGDEGEKLEPAGRKVFTLTLLAILIARGTFAPVSYDGHTKDETAPREYELAAEVLMPISEVRSIRVSSLNDLKAAADTYKVTPSAFAMRARKVGLLNRDRFVEYMDELATEYANHTSPPMRNPLPVNALRKYNGAECSRRMLALLDSGSIGRSDFCRVMFSNKLKSSQIDDFRAVVR